MEGGLPTTYETQANEPPQQSSVFFDRAMIYRRDMLTKIGEAVCCLLGIICVACATNPYLSAPSFFNFVASTGIIVAIIIFLLYVIHLREKLAGFLPLTLVELIYAAVWCFFFFATSTDCVVHGSKIANQTALIGAGFFGYVAMVLYGLDAFVLFAAWRAAGGSLRASAGTTQQTSTPTY